MTVSCLRTRLAHLLGGVLLLMPVAVQEARAQERAPVTEGAAVEWPYVGGDAANTRYSAADTLTPDTVDRLGAAWTWRPADRPRQEFGTIPGSFTSTPIMVDGTVYVSSNYNRVAPRRETGPALVFTRALADACPPSAAASARGHVGGRENSASPATVTACSPSTRQPARWCPRSATTAWST